MSNLENDKLTDLVVEYMSIYTGTMMAKTLQKAWSDNDLDMVKYLLKEAELMEKEYEYRSV